MLSRYVRLVFHATPVVLVAVFTFGFLLAERARLLGIPLAAILISWFFKYCFALLDAVVAGNDEPPVLSVEMVNPFNEMRPLGLALLIAAAVSLVIGVKAAAGTGAALLLAAAAIVLLPANIAVLAISGNLFHAAWPPRLIEVIRGLRWDYLLLNAATLAAPAIVYLLAWLEVPDGLGLAAVLILFLLLFVLVGGALFEHRIDFGLESRTPQERRAERDRREHGQARQHTIDHAYEYFRHDKPLDGWREIQTWLAAHAQGENTLSEYHAVLDAASRWDDVRPADKLANELIGLLLAKRETGAALDVVASRLATNPKFHPVNAVRLAELASLAGKRALRRQLDANR